MFLIIYQNGLAETTDLQNDVQMYLAQFIDLSSVRNLTLLVHQGKHCNPQRFCEKQAVTIGNPPTAQEWEKQNNIQTKYIIERCILNVIHVFHCVFTSSNSGFAYCSTLQHRLLHSSLSHTLKKREVNASNMDVIAKSLRIRHQWAWVGPN